MKEKQPIDAEHKRKGLRKEIWRAVLDRGLVPPGSQKTGPSVIEVACTAQPCPGLQHFSYIIRNTLCPKKSIEFFIFNKAKSFFVLFQPLECSFNPRVGTNGQVLGGAHQWFVRGRNGAGHHGRPPKRRIPS